MMKMIEVKDLQKKYNDNEVLKSISFDVEKGDVIAVIGTSGCGKSTTLRLLIGLERADGGTILIEGEPLMENGIYVSRKKASELYMRMGMVFQNFNLFPHMTVRENLMLAPLKNMKAIGMTKEQIFRKSTELLEKVGLLDKADYMPGKLSGGQKQRVAIARALMLSPDIMLFDEPTSALDPELTVEVLKIIRDLAKEKMTMIVVTHEMGFARDVANKVIFMSDGLILEEGTPEILENPKNERLRTFLSKDLRSHRTPINWENRKQTQKNPPGKSGRFSMQKSADFFHFLSSVSVSVSDLYILSDCKVQYKRKICERRQKQKMHTENGKSVSGTNRFCERSEHLASRASENRDRRCIQQMENLRTK